ncbi:MAG: hypothetical protein HY721_22680 [Planctomycetes bacterium]|nr:hypothetical protein [Planctomycetota bacterium]
MRAKSIAPVVWITGMFLAAPWAAGAVRTVTFVNKEDAIEQKTADDLHIETDVPTSIDVPEKSKPFESERGKDGGTTHNLYGGQVRHGAEAKVTLDSPDQETIKITRWWWTIGGNALKDGDRYGSEHVNDDGGGRLSFSGKGSFDDVTVIGGLGIATGDGAVAVSIDGVEAVYTTQRGATPAASALGFLQFLGTLADAQRQPLVHAAPDLRDGVTLLGNVVGDPQRALHVEVLQQDSTQAIAFQPFGQPTPSCPPVPSYDGRNGDVNCSGARDMSDAVYMLNWLFLGGPAPRELAACAFQDAKCPNGPVGKIRHRVVGCYTKQAGDTDAMAKTKAALDLSEQAIKACKAGPAKDCEKMPCNSEVKPKCKVEPGKFGNPPGDTEQIEVKLVGDTYYAFSSKKQDADGDWFFECECICRER